MIKIVAVNYVKPDKVEEFKALAKDLVKGSQAEEGNISYTLNQSISDPTVLTFIEFWKDKAAIESHNASEHFTTICPKLGEFCAKDMDITIYTEVE